MRRWDAATMLTTAHKLFTKIHKAKFHSHPNHDIHFMARDMTWLATGIQSLINGNYRSQHIRRYYFDDEVVDQLEISDRIYQHVLLQQLKPTFKHITNKNCYHLLGPTGVKRATQQVRDAMQENDFHYVIRADIKSFYRSIQHDLLVDDIKKIFADTKVQAMLEDIVRNPIDTPYGYKNPNHGIALRGPLSQLFSAIFLKPLDDAFDVSDVFYARFQDDLVILCKTKRQFSRCRRKMMSILQARQLQLSRKKSKFCKIENGFHFLGIDYAGTQLPGNTSMVQLASEGRCCGLKVGHLMLSRGGVER